MEFQIVKWYIPACSNNHDDWDDCTKSVESLLNLLRGDNQFKDNSHLPTSVNLLHELHNNGTRNYKKVCGFTSPTSRKNGKQNN